MVVYVSCLAKTKKLARLNNAFTCESCKTEVSIKTLKRGSAIVFKQVSEEFYWFHFEVLLHLNFCLCATLNGLESPKVYIGTSAL